MMVLMAEKATRMLNAAVNLEKRKQKLIQQSS